MKRINPKVDDCMAAIVIMFAVPALLMICAVVAMILNGWRAAMGAP